MTCGLGVAELPDVEVPPEPCKSVTTLANAFCKSAGAWPLLTCEIKAAKPEAKFAFGSVVPALPVEGALPALALSPFTAWNRACMNLRTSDLVLLAAEVVPSESPSLSVAPPFWEVLLEPVAELVPVVSAGADNPRL